MAVLLAQAHAKPALQLPSAQPAPPLVMLPMQLEHAPLNVEMDSSLEAKLAIQATPTLQVASIVKFKRDILAVDSLQSARPLPLPPHPPHLQLPQLQQLPPPQQLL